VAATRRSSGISRAAYLIDDCALATVVKADDQNFDLHRTSRAEPISAGGR
jgi:hypothetical protein